MGVKSIWNPILSLNYLTAQERTKYTIFVTELEIWLEQNSSLEKLSPFQGYLEIESPCVVNNHSYKEVDELFVRFLLSLLNLTRKEIQLLRIL